MSADQVIGSCAACKAPIEHGQRYCVNCGERTGSRNPQLTQLLQNLRRSHSETEPLPAAGSPSSDPPRSGLALPSPRISTLLVIVFLGFGMILGLSSGSPAGGRATAAEQAHLDLVLPQASESSASSASEPPSLPPASEPPSVLSTPSPPAEEEATPAPASTPKKKSSKQSSGSGNSEGGAKEGSQSADEPAKKLPAIKHVFLIMLSDEPYASVFGPASKASYLAHTLEHQGELLVRYDAVAHEQLANEIALLSGQGATPETAANCPNYAALAQTGTGPQEQVLGNGCVYPASTQTLASQLGAKHLTWRAYIAGTGEGEGSVSACGHPVLGQADPSTNPETGPYATFVNPFVYFDSIVHSSSCAAEDVGLNRLTGDLTSAKRTASFSYIAPTRCQDGNPTPCRVGAPAGVPQMDAFLQRVVPEITESPAYKESGLLVITTDEAPSSGELADSSACCGQPAFPNIPSSAPAGLSPRGGGTVGALLLSPFVKGATTNQQSLNHFSLLRTIEDLFGLKHLGYAALPAVKSFEPEIFLAHAAQ